MWGTIFSAASSILGSGNDTQIVQSSRDRFRFKDIVYQQTEEPAQAVQVGGVGQSSIQYSDLLKAWDNYLTNEYSETAKRIGL